MASFVRKHTKGGQGADLVLNCVAASETEGSSLLAARPQGTVVFCCNSSTRLDNIANCPNDACVVLNPGGAQPGQVLILLFLFFLQDVLTSRYPRYKRSLPSFAQRSSSMPFLAHS